MEKHWNNEPGESPTVDAAQVKDPPTAPKFLTAHGQYDSHAITLSDGRANTSPLAGKPYATISWADIIARASNPTATPKDKAQLVIASTFNGCEGRSHEAQRDHGAYGILSVDVDKGHTSQQALQEALQGVVGSACTLIYTSAGATADATRWRAMVPLAEPLPGADYTATQLALFGLLGEQGILCDYPLKGTGQPVFLPNVPPSKRNSDGAPLFYRHALTEGPALSLRGSLIEQRIRADRLAKEQADAEAKAKQEARQSQRLEYTKATGDDFDPIEHFNANNSISDLLSRYGFEKGRGINWRSPMQTSKSYAFQERGDHWISLSGADADAGLGFGTQSGARSGSAFSLYAYFEHGNNLRDAVREYAYQVRPQRPNAAAVVAQPLAKHPSVEVSRAALTAALTGFRDSADKACLHVLNIDVGLGKTRGTIKMICEHTHGLRAKGDMRAVCLYAPTHNLNNQILANFKKEDASLKVVIRRGRGADNPDRAGQKMCQNLEAIEEASKYMLDPQEQVCKTCPFKDDCAYLKSQAEKADVYILPHASLNKKPPAVKKGFEQGLAFSVIDEAPDHILPEAILSMAALEGMRSTQKPSFMDMEEQADLIKFRDDLESLVTLNGEGPIAADLARGLFTNDGLSEAITYEYARKVETMDHTEIEHNRTISRMVRVWRELLSLFEDKRAFTARLLVFRDVEGGLSLRIRSLMKPHDKTLARPILMLDATAKRPIVEATMGEVDVWHEVRADTPHMRVEQDFSRSFSMGMLQADMRGVKTESTVKAAKNNRQRLIKAVWKRSGAFDGQPGLVVTYKATADAIRGHVPDNVLVMHFGDLRGRNDAEGVRWVLIAGRIQTSDRATVAAAETLLGEPIETTFGAIEIERAVTDGKAQWTRASTVSGFSDPLAQSCLEAVRDAEIVQAVGRGRGVNRTADNPLDVLILGNAIYHDAVHVADGAWDDMTKRDIMEDQMDAGGIAYAGSRAAFAAYGSALAKSESAMKKAFQRLGDIPLKEPYRGLSPSEVRIKVSSRAPHWTTVFVDTARHANPRAAIEEQLGPLASYEVIYQPRRLVMLPEAEQLDTALMAEWVASVGEPATGFECPKHKPRSYFMMMLNGSALMLWTRRKVKQFKEPLISSRAPPRRSREPYLHSGMGSLNVG